MSAAPTDRFVAARELLADAIAHLRTGIGTLGEDSIFALRGGK